MSKILRPITRIFAWRMYHRSFILDNDPYLKEKWKQGTYKKSKKHLPSFYPLLSGAIQASDFVLRWGPSDDYSVNEELPLDKLQESQKLFEIAAITETVELEVDLKIVNDLHNIFTFAIILITVFGIISFSEIETLMQGSNLTIASILLIPPIIGLFAFSRLLRATHERRETIDLQLTRLLTATHAFNTLKQIKRMQQRLDEKAEQELQTKMTDEGALSSRPGIQG